MGNHNPWRTYSFYVGFALATVGAYGFAGVPGILLCVGVCLMVDAIFTHS